MTKLKGMFRWTTAQKEKEPDVVKIIVKLSLRDGSKIKIASKYASIDLFVKEIASVTGGYYANTGKYMERIDDFIKFEGDKFIRYKDIVMIEEIFEDRSK
jgi:hypothetical protein